MDKTNYNESPLQQKFLELNPDTIVLEPSGHWYSHFWVSVANKHNIKHSMKISELRGFAPIIAWLAGSHQNKQYVQSVVHELDIKISDYTRSHCKSIVEIELRITECYDYLEKAMTLPEFKPYLRVFDKFGFGLDNKVLLLYQCYPFEKFLVNDKAWIEYEESKGKLQKRAPLADLGEIAL